MDTVSKQYRHRAGELAKLAETAISEYHRRATLQIAWQWGELADQREQRESFSSEHKCGNQAECLGLNRNTH
jgi:hypothetical protein